MSLPGLRAWEFGPGTGRRAPGGALEAERGYASRVDRLGERVGTPAENINDRMRAVDAVLGALSHDLAARARTPADRQKGRHGNDMVSGEDFGAGPGPFADSYDGDGGARSGPHLAAGQGSVRVGQWDVYSPGLRPTRFVGGSTAAAPGSSAGRFRGGYHTAQERAGTLGPDLVTGHFGSYRESMRQHLDQAEAEASASYRGLYREWIQAQSGSDRNYETSLNLVLTSLAVALVRIAAAREAFQRQDAPIRLDAPDSAEAGLALPWLPRGLAVSVRSLLGGSLQPDWTDPAPDAPGSARPYLGAGMRYWLWELVRRPRPMDAGRPSPDDDRAPASWDLPYDPFRDLGDPAPEIPQ